MPFVVGTLIGAFIVALYVMSRTQVIVIASPGESLHPDARNDWADCLQFIDDLARAKLALVAAWAR